MVLHCSLAALLAVTISLLAVIVVSHAESSGCCTTDFNICVERLPKACLEDNEQYLDVQNTLLSCTVGQNPITIKECPFFCQPVEGRNSICTSSPSMARQSRSTARSTATTVTTTTTTGKKRRPKVMTTISAVLSTDSNGLINGEVTTVDLVRALGLPNRVANILVRNNYHSVDDVKQLTRDRLMAAPLALSEHDALILVRLLDLKDEIQTTEAPTEPPTVNWKSQSQRRRTSARTTTTLKEPTTGDGEEDGDSDETEEANHKAIMKNFDTKSFEVQGTILGIINTYRRDVKAANMLKVSWDSDAAESAQIYANQCVYSTRKGTGFSTKGSTFDKCGQNLALGDLYKTWADVFADWHGNSSKFRLGKSPCAKTGALAQWYTQFKPYTQLVWAHSYQIGCAVADCPPKGQHFVCHFCAQGNFNGNCEPYLAGTPSNGGICGKCGGADSDLCDDGLCTNPCPYENRYKDCDERFPDTESCNDATNPNSPNRPGCEATCNCRSTEQIYWIN